MHVGQPEQPLQRALFDAYGLSLGMWHNVACVGEPALFGDQRAVVPAVAQRPEVEQPKPPSAFGRGVELNTVKIETWQYASHSELFLIVVGEPKKYTRRGGLIVITAVLA